MHQITQRITRTLPLMLLPLLLTATYSTASASDDDCRGNCRQDGDVSVDVRNDSSNTNTVSSTTSVSNVSNVASQNDATAGATAEGHSTASATGGNQEITFTSPDDVRIRNVASPDTPNPYPTAPCRVGVSAGFSLAGGALSGGGSVEDEECTLRETARSFKDLGVPELGLILLCEQSEVIVGKRDKKGELEDGETPFGSERCLDLVSRYLDGPETAETDDTKALQANTEALEKELASTRQTSQQALMEVDQLRNDVETLRNKATQIIREEYLDDNKKAALAALLSDEEKD